MSKLVFKTTKTKYDFEIKSGQTVFVEDDLGTEMYIIRDGQVEIVKDLEGEERQLAVLGQGDFFGEMSILEDMPRTATARALVDCKLLAINGTTFDQMLRKDPEITVRIMRKLSRRLRETDRMLRDALGAEESQAPEVPPQDAPPVAFGTEKLIEEATGTEFFISKGIETAIGRSDPVTGITPHIDLTTVDTQRSISRRHATILRREHRFFVREEVGTMNGTFVNEQRLETGAEKEFTDGDEVRFGLVKTRFQAG